MSSDAAEHHAPRLPPALIEFRHDAGNAGVSFHGPIERGGWLVLAYDPRRLLPDDSGPVTGERLRYYVNFGNEAPFRSGTLQPERRILSPPSGGWNPACGEEQVPWDATRVDVWIECVDAPGSSRWDSRYGQNYCFDVEGQGLLVPDQSLAVRAEATVDPSRIRVVEDTATKASSRIGAGGTRLHTELIIRAELATAVPEPQVWADIHVFDTTNELIQTNRVTLQPHQYAEHGRLMAWAGDVYQGSQGGAGLGVSFRPDAHLVQYRVYAQVGTGTFTDGVLHEFAVPADTDVRQPS